MRRIIVAITGASGIIYARRFLEVVLQLGCEIHLTITENAVKIANHELGLGLECASPKATDLPARRGVFSATMAGGPTAWDEGQLVNAFIGSVPENIIFHHYSDLTAPISSGSFETNGMIIIPCSMGTLGRIASGVSTNLIERAADVCLKERRKLILVTREAPLSIIHLENMLRVSQAGAIVLPASPGFYSYPKDIMDLVDFVVARALDQLGIKNDLVERYGDVANKFPLHE